MPCPPATTVCGALCVDLQDDPSNCGVCGHACPAPQACNAGQCTGSCAPDADEPDDAPATARPLAFDFSSPYQARLQHEAALCAGDEDYYVVSLAGLEFVPTWMQARVGLAGAWSAECYDACNLLFQPDPRHALIVEILDAATLAPIATGSGDRGTASAATAGPLPQTDVLIHVKGAPEVEEPYLLLLHLQPDPLSCSDGD
jgi:hypothetical protein